MIFHQVCAYIFVVVIVAVVFTWKNSCYTCLQCGLWSGSCFSPQHALMCFDFLTRLPLHASSATVACLTIRPGHVVYDNSQYVGFWPIFVEMCAVVDELFVLCFVTKPWSTEIDPMQAIAALLPHLLHIDWWTVMLWVSFTLHMRLVMHCATSAALELNASCLWYHGPNAQGRLRSVRRDVVFPFYKHS